MYRSTSKDEQIRVKEGYREEQNNAVERSQQKERENKDTNDDVTYSTKEKLENLKKDLKYIKETLNVVTSQQWLANKEEADDSIKEIKKLKRKEPKDNSTLSNKRKQK